MFTVCFVGCTRRASGQGNKDVGSAFKIRYHSFLSSCDPQTRLLVGIILAICGLGLLFKRAGVVLWRWAFVSVHWGWRSACPQAQTRVPESDN